VSGPRGPSSPREAGQRALVAAGERRADLTVIEVQDPPSLPGSAFAQRFPGRTSGMPRLGDAIAAVVERAGAVVLEAPVRAIVEDGFAGVVRHLVVPRRNVKILGDPGTVGAAPPALRDDVGAFRSLPGMTVVAPADGPTVGTAVEALVSHEGPAYLRLPEETALPVTDGSFLLGRAHELRGGSDLTIVALGPTVARAVELAEDLLRVGLGARVLDVASVKPFDQAAILRAARDTGAILVVEPAPLATGVGALVAAMTSESYPVPVRCLGLADAWPTAADRASLDAAGLSLERLRDEAWELLRRRGKVS